MAEQSKLLQEIRSWLCRDLELDQQSLHSLQSLWGIENPAQLQDFLDQAGDSEIQTLLELILFPDQECKLRIHSCLGQDQISPAEQGEVFQNLIQQPPQARIFFPEHAESVLLELDPGTVDWFLARLQLSRPLSAELNAVLQGKFPQEEALRISLQIKSRPELPQGSRQELLLGFLSRADPQETVFWHCLQLVLDLSQEMDPGEGIWNFLVRKKLELEHSLRLAQKLNQQLDTLPMEALLMQRVSILCINQDQVREQLLTLDRICLMLFEQIPETDLPLWQTNYSGQNDLEP
ncbi:MAG: hypothetical protein R6U22_05535 [Desulfohalobiaceae bacterium]